MVSPYTHPVDDREGHLPFEPFSPSEWAVTILLALICFGLPLVMVIQYQREMVRLDAAAIRELKGGPACDPMSRVSSVPFGSPGSASGSTRSRSEASGGQGGE